ncbi:nucleoside monophosphate kinase [Candidatus Saccharibacteria bacterium]|nr:nucleoside monophosphate kinase [Candidatus Saccharibacteria bacterium]
MDLGRRFVERTSKEDSELQKTLDTGGLVDDEYVTEMMQEAYKKAIDSGKQVILDGYPRDKWQAEWLIKSGDIKNLTGAIVLTVDKDELWNRLTERGRDDDMSREVVEKRWNVYEQNIEDILPLFDENNVDVEEIDGVGEVEEVTARIEEALEAWELIPRVDYDDSENEHERSYGE